MDELVTKELYLVLEQARVALAIVSRSGAIEMVNSVFLEIMRLPSTSSIQGKQIDGFFAPGEADMLALAFAEVSAKKIERRIEISAFPGAAPEPILLELIIQISESVDCYRITARDITQQWNSAQKSKTERDQLAEADQFKTNFFQSLSYTVRTPLNAIIGFANLLSSESTPKEKRGEYIDYIKNSGSKLLTMIEDMNELIKLQSKQIAIKEEFFPLNPLLYEIYNNFLNQTDKIKNGKLTLKWLAPMQADNLRIKTDANRLRLVITSSIGNLINHTSQGIIEFGYTIEQVGKEEMVVFFARGANRERKQDLPERRPVNLRVNDLSITIAEKTAELLGAKFHYTVANEMAADFQCSLPCQYSLSKQTNQAPGETAQKNTGSVAGKTVLVAEDEELNEVLIVEILRRMGVKAICARNGKEAVDLFIQHRNEIDAILMDIKMPIMNGYDATLKIRELSPNVPIIGQTAFVMGQEQQKILDCGCNECIVKPIKYNVLSDVLYRYTVTPQV